MTQFTARPSILSYPALRPTLMAIAIAQLMCMTAAYAAAEPEAAVNADAQAQPLQEVVVSGNKSAQKPDHTKVTGFIDQKLIDTPFSVNTWGVQQLQDLQIRLTTDVVKYDASINDAYNAVGYAEQFSIRGFALDNEYSYRKDGFAIPDDGVIPLENKETIEILKGVSGFESGFATPGGIINYVTKRPTDSDLRSITTSISERGTLYGALDLGGTSSDKQFGYRINAAEERLRSYIIGANGNRQFLSGAFDWHLSSQSLLQFDFDYQHRAQISAPGFQLTNGTDLPQGIRADMMLNNQPWSKPVDTTDSDIGLRYEYKLNSVWTASISVNKHEFKRNDYTAFPYGCSTGNIPSGYCANGDYDVYDYQSVGESKSSWGSQALLSGKFTTGSFQHKFAVGLSDSQRKDYFGEYVYDFAGTSNIFHPIVVGQSTNSTGPVMLQRTDKEWSAFVQDAISLSDAWTLHAGIRHLNIHRTQLGYPGYQHNYWVPNVAIVYKPTQNTSLYASFAQGLEHGTVAPVGTNNATQMLDPAKSKQLEIGIKTDARKDLSLSAALFRIQKPLEYIDTNQDSNFNNYIQNGTARHTGLEFTAQGKVTSQLTFGASLTALDAIQEGTGDASQDGKRVLNVSKLKSTVYVDYAVASIKGLDLNASWQYSGNKAYTPDNSVLVPSYQVYNAGARYVTRFGNTTTTLRFNVDNVFNKFYWRDATQELGGYLFPGASRIYKLSAQFDF
ncbi:TonB-dependent siderophore receptor [Undibacterium sp. RuRC25W]|uniref:TonB-dependent siderophore receptor n=1 Tax=Undibacterium sp. RuRC25W TaxID=3413047 RepID=UPI003BF35284